MGEKIQQQDDMGKNRLGFISASNTAGSLRHKDVHQVTYHSCFHPRHCRSRSHRRTSRIVECTEWCQGHSWTHSHDRFLYLPGYRKDTRWLYILIGRKCGWLKQNFETKKIDFREKSRNEAQVPTLNVNELWRAWFQSIISEIDATVWNNIKIKSSFCFCHMSGNLRQFAPWPGCIKASLHFCIINRANDLI